jgi:hypothetical protein
MGAETITIGGQEFRPRKRTYAAFLAAAPHQDAIGDQRDIYVGLQVELEHAQAALVELAEADGEFDAGQRDELVKKRAELRRSASEAAIALFRLRLQEVAARLEPQPEVEYLLENLDDQGLDEVLDVLNAERPTTPPSDTESATP